MAAAGAAAEAPLPSHHLLLQNFIIFVTTALLLPPPANSQLSTTYYDQSCPRFLQIVQEVTTDHQIKSPVTAAATLRLFFHDCFVDGCDASMLISSNQFNKGERDVPPNLSLSGDGFDVITRVKAAVELECPGTVSCADIIAASTRDLISMIGGPFYQVQLGRKDSLVTNASHVQENLPRTQMPLPQIMALFASKGFTVLEMVTLMGAHTVGFAHCKEFASRIFNFSDSSDYDPAMYPPYAQRLRKLCENYTRDRDMSAFNDPITPGKFDNMYYINLLRGLALLPSDEAVATDPKTKPIVDRYAANQTAFFEAFAMAIEKLSLYNVKTGGKGEVRRRCDTFNTLKTI